MHSSIIKQPAPFEPSEVIPISSIQKRALTEDEWAEGCIPFGRRVGHLLVGPQKPVGEGRQFYAQCDCGTQIWKSATELLELVRKHRSCGEPACTANGLRERVWYAEDSLRMQLYLLLLLAPEEFQSPWGGCLDEMVQVGFEEGLRALREHLSCVKPPEGKNWLVRIDEDLPFIEGNVTLGERADKILRGVRQRSITVEGQQVSVKELCSISGLTPSKLLVRIYRLGTTENLFYNLMTSAPEGGPDE